MSSLLTAILSQYELLQVLCGHLSSADIIHLATTNKEHWSYIASRKATLEKLNSDAVCDGRGIIAQAAVFGFWKGKPDNAVRSCLGEVAYPCDDCGAKVCNECRFHLWYPSDHPPDKFCCHMWQSVEIESADEILDSGFLQSGCVPTDDQFGLLREIEAKKAFYIFWKKREQRFCDECEPVTLPWLHKYSCLCDFHDHFVGRWRCIPCVLEEETKMAKIRNYISVRKQADAKESHVFSRSGWPMDAACNCGKMASADTMTACRFCGHALEWRGTSERKAEYRERFEKAGLGDAQAEESNDDSIDD